jgi:hypothetical protein
MPQSIQNITPEYYQDKYDDLLIKMAQKEVMKERFLLGEGLDKDKFLHTSLMQEKVCVDSCSMHEYLWKKIKGELKEECPPKKEGFHLVYKIYEESYCNIVQQTV